jgi:hypothetical protein
MSTALVIELLKVLGIPLIASAILTFLKVLAGRKKFAPVMGVEIGMDLSILAAGACGGIFCKRYTDCEMVNSAHRLRDRRGPAMHPICGDTFLH